jgi:hypothetical protein
MAMRMAAQAIIPGPAATTLNCAIFRYFPATQTPDSKRDSAKKARFSEK